MKLYQCDSCENYPTKCNDCNARSDILNRHPCYQPKPKTNFDKITESVESFVKWIYSQYGGSPPDMPCKETSCENPNCKECFKEWLQKECEE